MASPSSIIPIASVRARHGSLRGRNSRLPQDRRSGLARASAARRARRAAHRMCAVQSALIRGLGTSFSLNMTGTSKQELKMHAQAEPERPKGEGHGWPEFHSPQMRHQGRGDSGFSLSRLPTAQTPWPRPYGSSTSSTSSIEMDSPRKIEPRRAKRRQLSVVSKVRPLPPCAVSDRAWTTSLATSVAESTMVTVGGKMWAK